MSQIQAFEAMLAKGQDSEMLRFTLGNAYLAQGDTALAAQHFEEAVKKKPDYSAAWKMLGRALAADERPVEAIEAFDEGLKVAESNGDKQTVKEITVFRKRAQKQLPDS